MQSYASLYIFVDIPMLPMYIPMMFWFRGLSVDEVWRQKRYVFIRIKPHELSEWATFLTTHKQVVLHYKLGLNKKLQLIFFSEKIKHAFFFFFSGLKIGLKLLQNVPETASYNFCISLGALYWIDFLMSKETRTNIPSQNKIAIFNNRSM